jgi:DNA-nicking Smr family endonuclease
MAKVPKKSKDEKKPLLTDEERELFLTAFYQGGILPAEAIQSSSPVPVDEALAESLVDEDEKALFLRALKEEIDPPKKNDKRVKHEKTSTTQSRKRKVDGTIDLHGMTVDEAITLLHRFLDREKRRGSRLVLVIHGRGTGALKKAVWAAVDTHPLVDTYQGASKNLGGQGAIVIRLRRRR